MNQNKRGRARWNGNATPKTTCGRHRIAIHRRIKAVILCLGLWGLIPAGLATKLLQCWGLTDA